MLAGLAALAGGTGLSLYGNYQRGKAVQGALGDYRDALEGNLAAQRASMRAQGDSAYDFSRNRLSGISDYVNEMTQPTGAGAGDSFMSAVGKTQDAAAAASPEFQPSPLGETGAFREAVGQQQARTAAAKGRLGERVLSSHRDRVAQDRAKSADIRRKLGELLLDAKEGDARARFKLSDALRELNFQHESLALQRRLDDAQRVGQWANILGGLGQDAGGMLATGELANAEQPAAGGMPNFGGSYGPNSPGALDLTGAPSYGMA